MKTKAIMAGPLMFVAGVAVAQVQPSAETAKPDTAPAVSEVKNPDKIRCERMAVTGSRLGGKVCHTEAEWARIETRSDELMRDIYSTPIRPINYEVRPQRTSGYLSDGLIGHPARGN